MHPVHICRSRSRSQEQKGNSASIKDGAMRFAFTMGFFGYGGSNGVNAIFVT